MVEGEPTLIEALARSSDFIGALDEFASIAFTIAHARAEIATLAPGDMRRDLPAGRELNVITRDAEAATHAIMNAAEAIAALAPSPAVNEEVTRIFEACAFQDINGQRVAKAIEALARIEERVARFAAAMGLPEPAASAPPGPGLNGPHTEQSAVDRLMQASESELALLGG